MFSEKSRIRVPRPPQNRIVFMAPCLTTNSSKPSALVLSRIKKPLAVPLTGRDDRRDASEGKTTASRARLPINYGVEIIVREIPVKQFANPAFDLFILGSASAVPCSA